MRAKRAQQQQGLISLFLTTCYKRCCFASVIEYLTEVLFVLQSCFNSEASTQGHSSENSDLGPEYNLQVLSDFLMPFLQQMDCWYIRRVKNPQHQSFNSFSYKVNIWPTKTQQMKLFDHTYFVFTTCSLVTACALSATEQQYRRSATVMRSVFTPLGV
jgi:hypothetical protein